MFLTTTKRGEIMKRTTILTVSLVLATAAPLFAQQRDAAVTGERMPPPREGAVASSDTLTDAQAQQVKDILAKYDANAIAAEQAKTIHEAFRAAGLHGGPALNAAVRAAGFDPDKLRDLAPPPGRAGGTGGAPTDQRPPNREGGQPPDAQPKDSQQAGSGENQRAPHGQQYTLAQATSDRAQLSTIAFSGLAFLTGEYGADTFIPPGKVCDYFGFQYMRDIDAAQKGHNPKFLDRVAGNVLRMLTDEQRKLFVAMAQEQAIQFNELAVKRFPLIQAFYRELKGDIPAGSAGLNKAAVMQYVGDIFAFDAELSYKRAKVFGQIVSALTADQKATLAKMKFGDFNTWPEVDMDQYKLPKGTDRSINVAYMTYASEFFSWYAGSVEADVYFCPERHGTYFGSFYMKDMPAMGKKDYDISTAITGDSGEMFLQVLTAEQRDPITAIIGNQRKDLQEIITVRRAVSAELRKYLNGGAADEKKVLALGRRYGELDGEMSWMYATAFAKANRTLTEMQRAGLKKLRNLDGYTNAPAYLYSTPMKSLPSIPNTDSFFFAVPASAAKPAESAAVAHPASVQNGFVLTSPEATNGGTLPKEFTGDGASVTLPLAWSGAPDGTRSYAVIMHHIDPEGKTKWYWTLYNIPAETKNLPKNVKDVGVLGNNSVNGRVGYAPPHSKGPGAKTYVYTVYALSAPLSLGLLPPESVTRDVLLATMKDKILETAEMKVVYTRMAEGTN